MSPKSYFDQAGREVRQRTKAVVLCANGAETPRLLLMSNLANSSGLVGKYLMLDAGQMTYLNIP